MYSYSDAQTNPRRLVLVAVGEPDRRSICAVHSAVRLPAVEHRAVHVAVDGYETTLLANWWMDAQPEGLRLEIVDDRGGVAETIATYARARLEQGFDEVLVLVGHLARVTAARVLLHDHTAMSIYEAVHDIPGVTSVLVPVGLES